MAPSQRSMLALLGLIASVQAVPAPYPQGDAISLGKPSGWVSWETAAPEPTPKPEDPKEPGFPVPLPKPTDQISLGKPSGWISWETTGPEPTKEPEEPGYPVGPVIPKPTDQISLGPPSFGVSWSVPEPTEEPEEPEFPGPKPTPSNQISLYPPSYSLTWETQAPQPTEDPEEEPEKSKYPTPSKGTPAPPKSTKKPGWGWPSKAPKPTRSRYLTWETGRPKNTGGVTWNKRQWEEDPQPTAAPIPEPEPEFPEDPDFPDFPEDPEPGEGPIIFPPFPQPSNPNTIGLGKPSATVIWGKNKREPQTNSYGFEFTKLIPSLTTEKPKNTGGVIWGKRQDEDPTDDFPIPVFPTPTNEISHGAPTATIIWGKREAEADPQDNTIGIGFPGRPTISWWKPKPPTQTQAPPVISWGKREAAAQTDDIGISPTVATIIWSKEKREADAEAAPQQSNDIGIIKPSSGIIWGREAEPEANADAQAEISLVWPTNLPKPTWDPAYPPWAPKPSQPYVSWGKRDAAPEPTAAAQGPEISLVWPTNLPKPTWDPAYPPWAPKPSQPYVSWGKRDAEPEAEPTAAPQAPEFSLKWPTNLPKPTWAIPKPSQPYVSWGKRDAAPEPEPTAAPQAPEFSLVWPTNLPKPTWDPVYPPWVPKPSQPYVSWGKRDAAPEPTAAAQLKDREEAPKPCALTTTVKEVRPCPLIKCARGCISKIPAEDDYDVTIPGFDPTKPQICPATVTLSNKCPYCWCPPTAVPSAVSSSLLTPPVISTKIPIVTIPVITPTPACPAVVTATVVPPCVPPICPGPRETPCDFNRPIPKMAKKVRQEDLVIEKTYLTIATLLPTPTLKPTPKCTSTITRTQFLPCPTYTCVPTYACDIAQVVR